MTKITKSKFLITAGLTALLCVLLSPAAKADGTGLGDVTITLPTISGNAGDTIVVLGSLTNSSSDTLDFTSDNVTFNNAAVSGVADFGVNGSLGSAPTSIAGNSKLTGVDLFTVIIAGNAAPGSYDVNSYELDGTDANCNLDPTQCGVQLGTVEFSVNVQGPVTTPEPGTFLLLASGLLAGVLLMRRAVQ